MVDEKMKELQRHGHVEFPIARYEWAANRETDGKLECHWHDECEFFTVIEGSAVFSVDGVKTPISVGDVVFVSSDRLHMAEAVNDEPFRYRAVVFNADILCGRDDVLREKYIGPMLEGRLNPKTLIAARDFDDDARVLFDRLFNALHTRPPYYEFVSKAMLLELMALVFPDSSRPGEREYSGRVDSIKSVISYIHENYASQLTVSMLAQIARMSEGHFTRQFKKLTARSPIDYVKWIRLRNASRLMAETDEKLICIAIETGFNNVSYFTRSFNAHFGMSPTQFRKTHTAGGNSYAG